jgi:type I restriction enzyme S subunit
VSQGGGQQLPPGWARTSLGVLGSWIGGGTPPKDNSAYWTNGDVPWVSPKDMKVFEIHDAADHITEDAVGASATVKVPTGSVLIVTRSGILRHTLPVAVTRLPVALNQDLKALVPYEGLHPDYIAYALRSFAQHILHACTKDGTTVQSIEFPALKRVEIPLAPREEQERIADALDELFSDLDAGVAALERVREKLKLYRASLLKAAVEGALTAEWRAQHPHTEPASKLLERILAERRRRWEEDQLAKFKAKGQEPRKSWKPKYKEPVAPDTTTLPPLPEGWCWATLSQAAWSAGYGTSEKCRETNTGLAVLRIPNIIAGRLDLSDLKFAPQEYSERDEDLVRVGDLLVVRTNGSRSLIGRGAVVRDEQLVTLSFASYLIRLRLIPKPTLLRWVSLVWDSFHVRRWIETRAATSAGQYNISLGVLETLILPVPPTAEQEAIVEAVEDQLSVIDHLEADLDAKLKNAQGLCQAILRHAFTGQLVPQDPNDEPASELLKRIAAEREGRGAPISRRRRAAS